MKQVAKRVWKGRRLVVDGVAYLYRVTRRGGVVVRTAVDSKTFAHGSVYEVTGQTPHCCPRHDGIAVTPREVAEFIRSRKCQ